MKINKKIAILIISPLFFAIACGSTSSDSGTDTSTDNKISKTTSSVAEPKTESRQGEQKTDSVTKDTSMKLDDTKFVEGKHYVKISPPMQTDAPEGKVEVVELMWLGCPHCYELEPSIAKYKKNHPDFVDFKQIPAMLNRSWAADARTYYLADILDPTGEKELIPQLFQAIHEQRRNLRNPDSVLRLFKQFGYTEEQVKNVQNSMAFQAKLKRAQEIGINSKADAVPAIIINGKYRTGVYMAGSEENLFKIIKMLTEKEHKQK